MSGTGKSTEPAQLGRGGHRVVDTDDPGWIVHAETHGIEPMWDLDAVGALLDGHRAGWLSCCRMRGGPGALYPRFDAVVLLSASVDVFLARVVDRANPFGSRPEDRANIVSDLAEFERPLRAGADHEIVTTAPVEQVVAALERVGGCSRRASPRVAVTERLAGSDQCSAWVAGVEGAGSCSRAMLARSALTALVRVGRSMRWVGPVMPSAAVILP